MDTSLLRLEQPKGSEGSILWGLGPVQEAQAYPVLVAEKTGYNCIYTRISIDYGRGIFHFIHSPLKELFLNASASLNVEIRFEWEDYYLRFKTLKNSQHFQLYTLKDSGKII